MKGARASAVQCVARYSHARLESPSDRPIDQNALMTISKRWRQFALLSIVAVFAVLLTAWVGQTAARREAASQVDAIKRSIEVYALALRGTAARFNYLPFAAAQHQAVIDALLAPTDGAQAQRANLYLDDVNRRAGSDALYVIGTDGKTLAASNWNTTQSFVGQNYANRPYFTDARAGRSGQFYGIGSTTGIPGLFFATPVRRDGAVIGIVAVKVSLREIEAAWALARDPVMVADARGIYFIGSVAAWKFTTTRTVSAEDLQEIGRTAQYGPRPTFPLVPWAVERSGELPGYLVNTQIDGKSRAYLAVDELLPEFGWNLTVMTDHAPVARVRYITWTIGALGAGLLLLGALYTRLRQRRLDERAATQHEREQLQQQRLTEQSDARRELEVRVRERTAELQDAASFRKAMEDSLLVGMRARDLEGRIRYVNPALCDITGYAADELIGRLPPYPYWHPDDLDKHWQESDAALEGKAALTGFESRIRHRAGHDVHTMVYTAPLIDGGGKHTGWMSSVVDVTEQKRAEARQHLQEQQLQHQQRRAVLGEMATTLAHELNQPLMAISTYASLAKDYAELGNLVLLKGTLGDVQAQAQRAAEILRRIRAPLQPQTTGASECAINDLVANVMALLKPEIRAQQARIETHLQPQLPPVPGDPVLLEQVLLNLVLNSLQAMRETPAGQRLVEIETRLVDGVVQVLVTDHGPGIAPDVAARLFEPFFTTKADGFGLGLNICRTIIETLRGRLTFGNHADGGAIFTLHLACTP
jgi:two-component system sensor histidine kinase DctS